jgi:hypothetical protein
MLISFYLGFKLNFATEPMIEPISPSVCRSARRNTARKVSPVAIARADYCG